MLHTADDPGDRARKGHVVRLAPWAGPRRACAWSAVWAAWLLVAVAATTTGCGSPGIADESAPRVVHDPTALGEAHSHSHNLNERTLRDRLELLRQDGEALLEHARLDDAEARFRLMLQLDPGNPVAAWNLARVSARRGEHDAAVTWLDRSLSAGHINFEEMRRDPHLMSLHRYPPFESLFTNRRQYLDALAERRVNALRQQLGTGYRYHVSPEHHLIIATNHGPEVLNALIRQLTQYAEGHWARFLGHRPSTYITVVLPTAQDYRRFVPDPTIGGFYHPARKLLMAQDLGYTLRHEFTHALHFADLDTRGVRQRIWFLEGVATCFETSTLIDGVPTPLPNNRQVLVRNLLRRGDLVPWPVLFAMDASTFMKNAPAHYAEARAIAVWIWEQGKLGEFHERYCETVGDDPTGIKALVEVFGRSAQQLELEWMEWLDALPPYTGVAGQGDAWLGVLLRRADGGMTVIGLVPEGPAAEGGVRARDVIRELDDQPVLTHDNVLGVLAGHKPGDVVPVLIERDGVKFELTVTLRGRPSPFGHSGPLRDHVGRDADNEPWRPVRASEFTGLNAGRDVPESPVRRPRGPGN